MCVFFLGGGGDGLSEVDPPSGSVVYTIGVLESRTSKSISWILPGVWESGTDHPNAALGSTQPCQLGVGQSAKARSAKRSAPLRRCRRDSLFCANAWA